MIEVKGMTSPVDSKGRRIVCMKRVMNAGIGRLVHFWEPTATDLLERLVGYLCSRFTI